MLRKSDLPESFTFHQLRHTTASLPLNESVPVPVVSKYLRHANPGITMSTYAHIIDGTSGMSARLAVGASRLRLRESERAGLPTRSLSVCRDSKPFLRL